MDDPNNFIHDALRFAADNKLPSLNPMLTIQNDTRTRQQRRQEERKGVRKPDEDAAELARLDAKLRADRKSVAAARLTAGERKNPTDPTQWGGKLNIYTCDHCRAHIVTRDVSPDGVTPFMLPAGVYCPNKCGDAGGDRVMMTSSMYRVYDQSMREDYQWYAPEPDEVIAAGTATLAQIEHYSKGGLEIRKAVFDGEV
jgi:hypothetical protein